MGMFLLQIVHVCSPHASGTLQDIITSILVALNHSKNTTGNPLLLPTYIYSQSDCVLQVECEIEHYLRILVRLNDVSGEFQRSIVCFAQVMRFEVQVLDLNASKIN